MAPRAGRPKTSILVPTQVTAQFMFVLNERDHTTFSRTCHLRLFPRQSIRICGSLQLCNCSKQRMNHVRCVTSVEKLRKSDRPPCGGQTRNANNDAQTLFPEPLKHMGHMPTASITKFEGIDLQANSALSHASASICLRGRQGKRSIVRI